MVGTILTPTAIWKNFSVTEIVNAEILSEGKIDDLFVKKLKLEGREVEDGKVSIYAELYKKGSSSNGPAVILLQDFSINDDKSLVKQLVKKGYSVMQIDIAGFSQGKENYTEYPQSIEYANYEVVKDNLLVVEKDAVKTCWYEWSAIIRYAIKYLKTTEGVDKVGGLAKGILATALWQVAGTDESLDCAVFTLNSGWMGYKGVYKFGGMVEPQFSDDMYKFIAGIDPQSYAIHILCPALVLSATNNDEFDCDRAFDTISRIKENVYSAIHFSDNQINKINDAGYEDLQLFLQSFLQSDSEVQLPGDNEIKCEIQNGELVIEVKGDEKELASVNVFVAEEVANPALRCWKTIKAKKKTAGEYVAKFIPFNQSEMVFMYATLKYSNGFSTCTNIIAKKFEPTEVANTHRANIIYSSRQENAETMFTSADTANKTSGIETYINAVVLKKKGPMGIEGITHSSGLLTYMPYCKKYMPSENSILMLDVYAEEQADLVVTLITETLDEKVEYTARIPVLGGDVWHNVKIEQNKFKTAEGKPLKAYTNLKAIMIKVEGTEYLINNALWI